MSDIIKALASMPIHYILVLVGIVILIAAIVGEYKDHFKLFQGWQRISIASLGLLLILYFLLNEYCTINKVAKPSPTITKDTSRTTVSKPSSHTEANKGSITKLGKSFKTVNLPSIQSTHDNIVTSTIKSYSVIGYIKDRESERVLGNVKVRIGNQTSQTNKDGFFILEVHGYYGERKRIYIQKEGYEDKNVYTNIPSENFNDYLTKMNHEYFNN